MGIEKVITVVCDYPGCTYGKKGPAVVQWNETKVSTGENDAPEASNYLVFSSHNAVPKTFCCQICAASYFLPPGWDLVQKKVQTLPVATGERSQGDGYSPDGPCKCGHPTSIHNHWGCTAVMSKAPGDFCKCDEQGEDPT
jgi:hypothetical protein